MFLEFSNPIAIGTYVETFQPDYYSVESKT